MRIVGLTSLCVLLAAGAAWADFIDLPVKWSQPPALEAGLDYFSNHPSNITRADDFICDDPRPVVAVRWWGSYISQFDPRPDQPGFWKPMDISFHLSDGGPHPLSLPVNPYLSLQTVLAQEVWTGHFDAAGEPVYEYNAYLEEPFVQEVGEWYFMDIDDPFDPDWGWHEAVFQQLDFQAWQSPNHVGPWAHDYEVDLAFELMVPEPASILVILVGAIAGLIRRR